MGKSKEILQLSTPEEMEPRQSPNTAGNLTSQTGGVFSSHIFPLLTYPYSLTGHIFAALLKMYSCVSESGGGSATHSSDTEDSGITMGSPTSISSGS